MDRNAGDVDYPGNALLHSFISCGTGSRELAGRTLVSSESCIIMATELTREDVEVLGESEAGSCCGSK